VDPALRNENNLDRLRDLSVPLLVVAGADDNVTDPSMARRLYREAGSADKDLVVVEEGGHNGLHDAPAVQSAYRALVEAVAPAGSPAVESSRSSGPDPRGAGGP
jgi:hypothetical protein